MYHRDGIYSLNVKSESRQKAKDGMVILYSIRVLRCLLIILFCYILIGCASTGSTSLVGQQTVFSRGKIGELPSLRIRFPNVRRDSERNIYDAFSDVLGNPVITPSIFGQPTLGIVALCAKAIVDLVRSGADRVSDAVIDIDGLASTVRFSEVQISDTETTIKGMEISFYKGWYEDQGSNEQTEGR